MSRNNYWLACGLFCLLLAACSEEDGDGKDLDKPLIESGDSASPLNCQVYRTGEEIMLVARFRQELYSYKADAASHTDGKSVAAPEYLLFTLDDSCSRLVSVPCCDTCFFASSCGKMNTQN